MPCCGALPFLPSLCSPVQPVRPLHFYECYDEAAGNFCYGMRPRACISANKVWALKSPASSADIRFDSPRHGGQGPLTRRSNP